MNADFSKAKWLNEPKRYEITDSSVKIITEPDTDFWERSYYGFRHENSPALLFETDNNFTFTTRVQFEYQGRYEQSGPIIYIDTDNWCKVSLEYENEKISRLGSVVTNLGYSDWATTDIPNRNVMWYRVSRRGPDFLAETSLNGTDFTQLRIFHLHRLGETTAEMGRLDPPAPPERSVRFGLYACSPLDSSFEAVFDNFQLEDCIWKSH